LRFDAPRRSLATGAVHGQLELYAADQVETVAVNGYERPLEFESTTALAYTLEGSRAYAFELSGFLGDVLHTCIPQARAQDGLLFLHPPSLDRIPLVLVHGTASSPARWATRHLHIFAIRSGVRRELAIPLSLREKVERVLTLPSDAQLQALAHQLAEGPTPDEGPLEAIELQVWATQFDPDTLAPSSAPIRFRTVRPNAPR
jgi:hypothetical protein